MKSSSINRQDQDEINKFNDLLDKYKKIIFFEDHDDKSKFKLGDQILAFRELVGNNKTIKMKIGGDI
jgi:hypothetical protein